MTDAASFVIEEVTDLDAAWPELAVLYEGLHNYHEPWFGGNSRPDWAARQRAWVAKEAGVVLMGRAEGRAIGFMTGLIRDQNVRDTRYGLLEHAYVVEEWRNRGVGRELLRRLEAWVAGQGVEELSLGVAAGNAAGIGAWTALGFGTWMHSMRKTLEVPA